MQDVKFVAIKERINPVVREDIFCLRKDRKYLWLQKLAIGILRRLGCQWTEQTVTYERVEINPDKFMDRLYTQRKEVFKFWNRECGTLLIGSEDYRELMGSPDIRQMLTFRAELRRFPEQIYGLEVKVVPWMRGVLVMP